MNISLLTRQQLEIINRKTYKYPLQIAEKDYMLAVVMQIIAESSWRKKLVFKGGTAINHCFLEQYRFSEDLDFSSNGINMTLEDVGKIFADTPFLTIKKSRLSEATVKIERLQYSGVLSQSNSLKVEIDFLQNVLLPPKTIKYQNVWGLDFKVTVMGVREICAEKIRAMSDRSRFRDFYDLFWLEEIHKVDLDEIVSYISQKEIRKPISKISILRNWKVVGSQKAAEMSQVFYSRKVNDDAIEKLIEKLPFTEISGQG